MQLAAGAGRPACGRPALVRLRSQCERDLDPRYAGMGLI